MRLRAFVLYCCVSQLLTGCLYLHSPARQKAAEEARVSFEAVAKQSAASTVATDYATQGELRSAAIHDLIRLNRGIQIDTLASQPWATLLEQTRGELTSSQGALDKAKAAQKTLSPELEKALKRLAKAQEDVKDGLKLVNAASREAARYAATQGLLREALLGATDATRSKSFEALRDVLAKEYKFTSYSLENGALKSTETKESAEKLIDIPVDLIPKGAPQSPADVESLIKKLSGLQQQPLPSGLTFKNPGIATTILGLAFDVARAEEQRISVAVDMAKRELALRSAQVAFLEEHVRRLTDDLNPQGLGLAAAASTEPDLNTTLRVTLERLALDYQRTDRAVLAAVAADPAARDRALLDRIHARGRLQAVYVGLANNFKRRIIDAQEGEIFANRLSAISTEHDLRDTAVRFGEREAVVGRGLEGLVAFHTGGITSEDLGRIIGIAQTIGIFVIAGGQ